MTEQLVLWVVTTRDKFTQEVLRCDLLVQGGRSAAIVWLLPGGYPRQAKWATYGMRGTEGERGVVTAPTGHEAVQKAKIEACASAVEQGFV